MEIIWIVAAFTCGLIMKPLGLEPKGSTFLPLVALTKPTHPQTSETTQSVPKLKGSSCEIPKGS